MSVLEQRQGLEAAVQKVSESLGLISPQLAAILAIAAALVDPLPPENPPETPTDLEVRLLDESDGLKAELVWTHVHTAGVDFKFEIQRDDNVTDGVENWVTISTLVGDVSTYEDLWGARNDLPYAYRVRAVNLNGFFSNWSNVADPKPFVIEEPPVTPTDPGDPGAGRTIVTAGYSFSGKKGKFYLKNGVYNITIDPESDLDILGESRDGVILLIDGGKQHLHRGATNVKFSGCTIDGKKKGGASEKLNDRAMIVPGDGWIFSKMRITGGVGVNVGCDGKNIRFYQVECDDGGSAGIGGKGDGSILINVYCHHNNLRVKDRDGAGGGKWTRTNGQLMIGCLVDNGTCAGWWHDISNSNICYIKCTITNIALAADDRVWTAAGFKEEISDNKSTAADLLISLAKEANVLRSSESLDGVTEVEIKDWNYIYKDCKVYGTYSYCVDWNETRDVFWHGGELGEGQAKGDGGSIGVRDLRRSDAKAKGMEKNWVLDNIHVKGVKARTGTLSVTKSGAGLGVTLDGNHLKFEDIGGNLKLNGIK